MVILKHNAVICTFPGVGPSTTPTGNVPPAAAKASVLPELNSHGRRALMPGKDIPTVCWPVVLGRIASLDGGSRNGTIPSGVTTVALPALPFPPGQARIDPNQR